MESAINRTITFGVSRKMTVISERLIGNKATDTYSLVTVKGTRGALKTAKRRFDGSYYIL